MARATRTPEGWVLVLGSTSLIAWSILALYWGDPALPAFCSADALWAAPLSVSFSLALLFNSPAKLALCWGLMIAAMMSPVLIEPLRHVHDRSFARRRTRAMLLFVAGYATVWMAAGVPLHALALAAQWAAPVPFVCLGLVAAVAIVWQVSPAKQWCLNRCHRKPQLAAFGAAAGREVFVFGLKHGAACFGTCWALMLLPFFVGQGHLVAMAAVTLFIFAERLESPATLAWRWRGLGKALRILVAQTRIQLLSRSSITEASR
jgi:predicted metal-binding membrane protein